MYLNELKLQPSSTIHPKGILKRVIFVEGLEIPALCYERHCDLF